MLWVLGKWLSRQFSCLTARNVSIPVIRRLHKLLSAIAATAFGTVHTALSMNVQCAGRQLQVSASFVGAVICLLLKEKITFDIQQKYA